MISTTKIKPKEWGNGRKERKKERRRNSYKEVFLKTFHQVPFFLLERGGRNVG